uniref:Uncharacterized protein n=1 Tax=Triticum urartu TaxID=4572 RepID=A0A8R7UWG9_TRIUA
MRGRRSKEGRVKERKEEREVRLRRRLLSRPLPRWSRCSSVGAARFSIQSDLAPVAVPVASSSFFPTHRLRASAPATSPSPFPPREQSSLRPRPRTPSFRAPHQSPPAAA